MQRCNIKLSLQLILEPKAFSVTSVRDDLNLGAKPRFQINEMHETNYMSTYSVSTDVFLIYVLPKEVIYLNTMKT
jgi:hypothetical protein